MRVYIFIAALLVVFLSSCREARTSHDIYDDVSDLKDTTVQFDPKLIKELENRINLFHEAAIKKMPKKISKEMLHCKSFEDMNNMSLESQEWVHENAALISDGKLAATIDKVIEQIENNGQRTHGDDITLIMKKALWAKMHDQKINIEKELESSIEYWRDTAKH